MQMIDKLQRTILWMLVNPDTGRVTIKEFDWGVLEPEKGKCCFDSFIEAAKKVHLTGRCIFVRILPRIPVWSKTVAEDYIAFLGELDKACKSLTWLYCIDVTVPEGVCDTEKKKIADAYRRGFPGVYKMVTLEDECSVEVMRGNKEMGIIINSDCEPVRIGQLLSEHGLQKVWEYAPIRLEGKSLSKIMLKNAVRWHVSSVETEQEAEDIDIAALGFRPEIRHCFSASDVKAGEMLPLKVWVVNSGNAPGYLDADFQVRLLRTDGEEELVWNTGLSVSECYPGEDIFRQMMIPISLGIEGRISDGFYSMFISVNVHEG